MNDSVGKEFAQDCGMGEAETALRTIANLPAPAGLADRVHTRLRSAPRRTRLFAWPVVRPWESAWARSAAAAAIVCVVAGGGWSIYSRVQPAATAKGVVSPHVGAPGGFSEGGAVRRPQTLNGPTVPNAATPASVPSIAPVKAVADGATSQALPAKKGTAHARMVSKATLPPAATAAK